MTAFQRPPVGAARNYKGSSMVRTTSADVKNLWDAYARQRDVDTRNLLVEQYLPLVRYTAERLRAKLPDEVELDDLCSAGVFGLMAAIDGFKPERGFKFETFCAPRIRGAILDYLRSLDWVPRLVRTRARQLEGAVQVLEGRLGRLPTEGELQSFLLMDREEFGKLLRDAGALGLVALNKKTWETDAAREAREIDQVVDRHAESPQQAVQLRDLKGLATRGLNKTERLIIVLYYWEELTMREIGATLDLSESRVSQMHSAIVNRLKGQLVGRRTEFTN